MEAVPGQCRAPALVFLDGGQQGNVPGNSYQNRMDTTAEITFGEVAGVGDDRADIAQMRNQRMDSKMTAASVTAKMYRRCDR